MQKTGVIPLTERVALDAADVSLQHGLAMADAIVYATAQAHDAVLVTSHAGERSARGEVSREASTVAGGSLRFL
jgi:predicted nucleic acid-binding protein